MSLWEFVKSAPWTCGICAFILIAAAVSTVLAVIFRQKD